jgi:hypothetical protein
MHATAEFLRRSLPRRCLRGPRHQFPSSVPEQMSTALNRWTFPAQCATVFFVSIFEKVRTLYTGPPSACLPSSVSGFRRHNRAIVRQRHSPSSSEVSDASAGFRLAFLTGSALQTEMAVTHSKQTTGAFLTGARTAFKDIRFHGNFHVENHAAKGKRRCP